MKIDAYGFSQISQVDYIGENSFFWEGGFTIIFCYKNLFKIIFLNPKIVTLKIFKLKIFIWTIIKSIKGLCVSNLNDNDNATS